MEKKQGPYSRTHQLISFKTEGPTALLLLQRADLLVCATRSVFASQVTAHAHASNHFL